MTVLLRLLLRLIGLICAFTVLPGKLIVSLSLRFIEATRSQPSSSAHAQQQQRAGQQRGGARNAGGFLQQHWWILEPLLWLPRWLVVNAILLAYVAQIGIVAATLTVSTNAGYLKTGLVASVALIVIYAHGNGFAKNDPWLCSWFPRAPIAGNNGVLSALLEVYLDLLSLFALLWCCLTGLRLPHVIKYAQQRKSGRQPSLAFRAWPAQARAEFWFFWLDIFRYATYILTPIWRWGEQAQAHSRIWTTAAADAQFSGHTRYGDLLSLDTSSAVGIAISGLADVPVYALLTAISPFTFWRLEETFRGLAAVNGDRDMCRSVALRQLLLCIADLATIIVSIPVLFTWRGLEMWNVIITVPHGSRKEAWEIVWRLVIDILDLHHFVMGFIITVTLWRARSLWKKLEGPHTRKEIQKIIEKTFVSWLLDIPCALLFVIVLITGWRAGNMIRGLKAVRAVKRQREQQQLLMVQQQQQQQQQVDVNDDRQYPVSDDMPPPPAPQMLSDWQSVVLEESSQLMIDAPFPVLALLTLWRFPSLLKHVFSDCDTAWERRGLVLRYLLLVLKDIPCGLMACIMFITLWRIPSLFSAIASTDSDEELHQVVFNVFKEWLLDIPSILCYLLACVLAPWRIPFVIIDLLEYTSDSRDARRFGYHLLFLAVKDIFASAILSFSLLISLRRKVVIFHLLHPVPHSAIPRDSVSRPLRYLRSESAIMAPSQPSSSSSSASSSMRAPNQEQHPEPDQNRQGLLPKELLFDRRQQTVRWNDGWFSVRIHWTAWQAWASLILDLWIIVMIAVIFLGIFQIPSFLLSMYSLTALYRRHGRTKNEPATVVWDYNSGVRQRMSYFEPPDAPLSLILFEYSISNHFFSTLNNLPHLLFLPLKLVSLAFFPLSHLIRIRYGTSENPLHRRTSSFLISLVLSMNGRVSRDFSFWTSHKYTVVMLLCLILVIMNELAVLLLPTNMILLFFSTAGFPLWSRFVDAEAAGGHASQRAQNMLRVLVFVLTTLATPVIFVVDAALLVGPVFLNHFALGFNSSTLITVLCAIGHTCVWAAMMHMTWITTEEDFEWFSPLAAYTWVFERLFSQPLWKRYVALLDAATEWCYPLRRARYGLIGELLLILISLVWATWPAALVLLFAIPRGSAYWLLAATLAVQFVVFMFHRAYHIVRRRWTRLSYGTYGYPVSGVSLTSVVPVLLPGTRHGFALEICGDKPSDFHVSEARLLLRGTKFWTAISTAMGPFWITVLRNVFHPIQLSPTFMDLSPLTVGITHCTCVFTFGTLDQPKLLHVSHSTLRRYLDQTAASGDPSVTVVIDYGHRSWGLWVIDGRLITFSLRIGALRDALFCSGGRRINLLETGGASIAPSDAAAAASQRNGPEETSSKPASARFGISSSSRRRRRPLVLGDEEDDDVDDVDVDDVHEATAAHH